MIIAELKQKQLFGFRNHYLYPDKITVESKSRGKIFKYDVAIESIGFEKHYEAESKLHRKIGVAFLLTLPTLLAIAMYFKHQFDPLVIGTFYTIFIALACVSYFHKTPQDDIFLTGGQKNLVFYRNVPDENTVVSFIDLIIHTSKQQIKQRFTRFDESVTFDVFKNRLSWLKENGLIDEVEQTNLIEEFKLTTLLS